MSFRTVIDAVKACLKNTEQLETPTDYQRVLGSIDNLETGDPENRVQFADDYAVALFELLAVGVKHDLPILDCFAALHETRYVDANGKADAEKLSVALHAWDERKKSMSGRHLELREEHDVLNPFTPPTEENENDS